jgi:predicted glutamine amidotransferase
MLMCCLHYLGDLLGRAGEDDGEGLAYFGARRAILLIGRKPIGVSDDVTVSKYRSACGQDGILISHGRKASLGQ